jgi:multidrug efflux system membrane fusion protein
MTEPMQTGPSSGRSAPRRRRGLALVAVLAVAVAAFLVVRALGPKQRPRPPRVAVAVAKVERRAIPLEIVTTGTVEPVQSASVSAQVSGVLRRIAFREGQDVAAGQVLFELDPRPFQAALEQARGALERDLAQWRSARLEAERADRLLAENLISAADHDRAVAAADALRAAVQADSGTVARARLDLEFAGVRAPIAGRTGAVEVHVGDLVRASATEPLVTINQVRPIRARFTVAQDRIPLLQRYRDGALRVRALVPGDSVTAEGRLVFVDNAVDPATGTLLLRGEFPNADRRLWPGQFVELRLVLAIEPDALVVPAAAVVTGQQGTYVYVLNADSTAAPRPVTVARTTETHAVVAAGLEPGETVVTDGQFRISPGAKVLVRGGGPGARP